MNTVSFDVYEIPFDRRLEREIFARCGNLERRDFDTEAFKATVGDAWKMFVFEVNGETLVPSLSSREEKPDELFFVTILSSHQAEVLAGMGVFGRGHRPHMNHRVFNK